MAITPREDHSGALAAFGVQVGPHTGEEIPIRAPVVRIGRSEQNEIVLPDDSVSHTHAKLEFENGAWRLTDLNSINGTSVEGTRLAPEIPTPLRYGSTVRFGGIPLLFSAIESADPEAARASYTPPPPSKRIAEERTGFRLPIWLLLLILLLIVLAAVVFGLILPDATPTAQPVAAAVVLPTPPPGR